MALEVCVKAAVGAPHLLGDCLLSQRVLLTLEEKNIPYKLHLIDLTNKPNWFLEASPKAKVPLLKIDDEWVSGSDAITELIEEKYPKPSLAAPPEYFTVGSDVFPAFVKFLTSKDPNDGSEEDLVDKLRIMKAHIIAEGGKFVNGNDICAVDLILAPMLYHLKVVLGHFKGWAVPKALTVESYMKLLFSRESFIKTKPSEECVIAAWKPMVDA